ncbi:MAG: MATE family efflux transporter [Chloroflexaceae bacterium]|nr:MATE family efflux transporter [Chloroflexaceae bacterium]
MHHAALNLLARLRQTPLRDWPALQVTVAEASVLYMAGFLVSALLGVVRQILLNARFGLGDEAAAFYAAFRLPETIGLLIAGGALTNALVPVLVRAFARGGSPAANRLVNLTLTALLGAFAPLGLLAALAAPIFVQTILAPGFDPPTQALTVTLTRILLLEVLLVISEAALVALLVSRNQILLPALAIALRNLTLIAGTVVALVVPEVGIFGPTIGSLFDALLQIVFLVPALRGHHYRPRLLWNPADPDLRQTLRLLWPNALSSLSNYAGNIVDVAFASLSGVTATVGALVNALLLIGLPVRLLGFSIGQAALPALAAFGVANNLAAFRALLRRTLLIATGASLLAALGMIALGRPLIALLFERGAFDAAAGDLTYRLLAIYALGLPAYVATEIATRGLVGRYDTRTPLFANLLQLGARIALSAALIRPLGPIALPVAFVFAAALETAVVLTVLYRYRLKGRGEA